MLTDVSLTVDI